MMELSRAPWRKSSYSGNNGGACVEVATTPTASALRDTKHRDLGALVFPSAEWTAFVRSLKQNEV